MNVSVLISFDSLMSEVMDSRAEMMVKLFDAALDELDRDADLVNQVLDVSMRPDEIHVLRYGLPS